MTVTTATEISLGNNVIFVFACSTNSDNNNNIIMIYNIGFNLLDPMQCVVYIL